MPMCKMTLHFGIYIDHISFFYWRLTENQQVKFMHDLVQIQAKSF